MSDPCDLTAVEALEQIRARQLSPVELFESCVERIDAINGTVNAVVAIDLEGGREHARRTEKTLQQGGDIGLLGGLPTGIKDLEATAGLRTTWGSLLFKDDIPEQDDQMVADIRSDGGNIFCKTNTPEFGAGGNTVNRVYGATGNPFNPELTCAGSSGGTAVALATGMMPVATGSDYGGSLRTPAAFCGITGFRPSPGTVPSVHAGSALTPFPVLGPMGRTVADAHLLLRSQAGFDSRDPFSSSDKTIPSTLESDDLGSLRVAWSADLGCCPIDSGIKATFLSRMNRLKSAFKECDESAPPMDNVHSVFEVLRGLNYVGAHAERLKENRDLLGPNVIDNTERGLLLTAEQIAHAYTQHAEIYRNTLSFFKDVDLLICPAAAVSPFPHSQLTVTEINGEKMPTYMRWLALSYVPTTTMCCICVLPCGLDDSGMPFGIQVIGPIGSDARVLAAASSIEQFFAADESTRRPLPDIKMLSGK
ncbi:hypothetical protein AB833_18625 [Chromatiales bacterium (ex Bugula neritina AB1)]|nr:hypothetical protein AB833_18625 [Chromatiales bacterium (ex Bugula neritina AB1)]